eukprot:147736-Pyramimonas_sp.AAC.1
MRRGKALCRARASVNRVACWWKCCAARGEIARTDSRSLAGRDEGSPRSRAQLLHHLSTHA